MADDQGLRSTQEPCKCGHPRERHYMLLVPGNATPGACGATVDKRHVSVGGPDLSPCDCEWFEPWDIEAVAERLISEHGETLRKLAEDD